MQPRSKERLPWYLALSTASITTAAIALGLPIPKAAALWSTSEHTIAVAQLFAYALLTGLVAFLLAQTHLERRRISGYRSDSAFVTLFAILYAVTCAVGGVLLFELAKSVLSFVVYEWPGNSLANSGGRAQTTAAIFRALFPVAIALMVVAAWLLSISVFNGKKIKSVATLPRRIRAAGMFAGVVTVASLFLESATPTITPTRFIWAQGLAWGPAYGTLAVLLWISIPTFVIAVCVAPRNMTITRPVRLLAFGVGTIATIQALRFALMFFGWGPLVMAVDVAGYFSEFADFPEQHPLLTLAIAHTISLLLTLPVVWGIARFALGSKPTDAPNTLSGQE